MAYEVRHHKLPHTIKPHMRSQYRYYPPQPPTSTDLPPPTAYPPSFALPYSAPPVQQLSNIAPISYQPISTLNTVENTLQQEQRLQQALADVRRHGRNERIGEIGAAAAGAFALYELHEAKVDPAHARRHKLEAEVAGAVAAGSASYALHEHQEKKKSQILVNQLQVNSGSSMGRTSHFYLHGPQVKHKHGAASTKDKSELLSSGDSHKNHNCKHPHRHRFWP